MKTHDMARIHGHFCVVLKSRLYFYFFVKVQTMYASNCLEECCFVRIYSRWGIIRVRSCVRINNYSPDHTAQHIWMCVMKQTNRFTQVFNLHIAPNSMNQSGLERKKHGGIRGCWLKIEFNSHSNEPLFS